jgi:hypothetical protein
MSHERSPLKGHAQMVSTKTRLAQFIEHMDIELVNMIQLFISSLIHELLCNIVKHREFEVQAFAIDVFINHKYA